MVSYQKREREERETTHSYKNQITTIVHFFILIINTCTCTHISSVVVLVYVYVCLY